MKLMLNPLLVLLALLISNPTSAQARAQKSQKPPQPPSISLERVNARKPMRPPSGPSFYIAPLQGSAGMFSVLLADGGGSTVAGSFTLRQIEIFEAVLEEAKAFALTDERVGTKSPLTTRLMEQHEWSLFVDVSKIGDKSRFFISLVTPQGNLTAAAGEITRGSKDEPSAMLLNVLSQIREAKGRTQD